MNRRTQGIKRIGVISFSVIYLLLALTYMPLLPNYNHLVNNGYYSGAKHLVVKTRTDVGADRPQSMMRKLFYAIPENKRQLIPGLLLAVLASATLFAITAIASLELVSIRGNLAAYAVLHRHTYLQYRSLRL